MPLDLIENFSARQQIALVYITYYDRAPEPAGMGYWADFYESELATGRTSSSVLTEISSRFADVQEAQELFPFLASPFGQSAEEFVQTVFNNLFNRGADPEGLEFWTERIGDEVASGQPIGDSIMAIAQGARGSDVDLVTNKIAAGGAYAEAVSSSDEGYEFAKARELMDEIDPDQTVAEARDLGQELATGPSVPEPESGAQVASSPVAPSGSLFDGVMTGTYWEVGSSRTITWALGDSDSRPFDPSAISAVEEWGSQNLFAPYEAAANLRFEYVGPFDDAAQSNANITISAASAEVFQNVTGQTGYLGIAQFPEASNDFKEQFSALVGADADSYPYSAGDIVINADIPAHSFANPGGDLLETLIHEVGHSLGLKHPFDDSRPGFPTFQERGVPVLNQDSFTAMAYNEFNNNWQFGNISTPMPVDIGALQYLYGPNENTASGDNTYQVYDDGQVQTVYDTDGTDFFDGSDNLQNVTLDLRPGFVSIISPLTRVGIAPHTTIEDAAGGGGNDSIIGNGVGNQLIGNGGADVISGGAGADFLIGGGGNDDLYGGAGSDIASFSGTRGEYFITPTSNGFFVEDSLGYDGIDLVSGVETLRFSDGDYSLVA